jgi:hypothetical protein
MALTTHMVVARFDNPGPAREAMVDLEGRGIDADAIHLLEPPAIPTREGGLHADLTMSRRIIDSYARSAVIGALIGAAVFIGFLLILRVQPVGMAVAIGAIGGALAGFLVGGYLGAARHIAVNEEAYDTYAIDPSDPEGVAIEVRVPDAGSAARAIEVLRKHHPRQLERRAA